MSDKNNGVRVLPHTLCVECGPYVKADEDGCCSHCGVTAVGTWLRTHRVTFGPIPKKRARKAGGK